MDKNKLEMLQKQVQFKLDRSSEKLKSFTQELQINPSYAFQWGKSAIEAAAIQFHYGMLLKALQDENFNVREYYDKSLSEVLRFRNPSSSSQLDNIMEIQMHEILCEILNFLKYFLN